MTSTENSIAGLMAEAAEWVQRGQNANAVSLWQRVLRLAPGHAPSLNYLGAYALAQGDTAEAALYLDRAIESDPGLAIAHANLSRLHSQRGDAARALEAITSAIHAEPTAWGAHFEKAHLLESAGRMREAATAWDSGLQYMPEAAKNSPQLQQLVGQAKAAVAERKMAGVSSSSMAAPNTWPTSPARTGRRCGSSIQCCPAGGSPGRRRSMMLALVPLRSITLRGLPAGSGCSMVFENRVTTASPG
jgi:tetratricopeptide (TPR) repeat protein